MVSLNHTGKLENVSKHETESSSPTAATHSPTSGRAACTSPALLVRLRVALQLQSSASSRRHRPPPPPPPRRYHHQHHDNDDDLKKDGIPISEVLRIIRQVRRTTSTTAAANQQNDDYSNNEPFAMQRHKNDTEIIMSPSSSNSTITSTTARTKTSQKEEKETATAVATDTNNDIVLLMDEEKILCDFLHLASPHLYQLRQVDDDDVDEKEHNHKQRTMLLLVPTASASQGTRRIQGKEELQQKQSLQVNSSTHGHSTSGENKSSIMMWDMYLAHKAQQQQRQQQQSKNKQPFNDDQTAATAGKPKTITTISKASAATTTRITPGMTLDERVAARGAAQFLARSKRQKKKQQQGTITSLSFLLHFADSLRLLSVGKGGGGGGRRHCDFGIKNNHNQSNKIFRTKTTTNKSLTVSQVLQNGFTSHAHGKASRTQILQALVDLQHHVPEWISFASTAAAAAVASPAVSDDVADNSEKNINQNTRSTLKGTTRIVLNGSVDYHVIRERFGAKTGRNRSKDTSTTPAREQPSPLLLPQKRSRSEPEIKKSQPSERQPQPQRVKLTSSVSAGLPIPSFGLPKCSLPHDDDVNNPSQSLRPTTTDLVQESKEQKIRVTEMVSSPLPTKTAKTAVTVNTTSSKKKNAIGTHTSTVKQQRQQSGTTTTRSKGNLNNTARKVSMSPITTTSTTTTNMRASSPNHTHNSTTSALRINQNLIFSYADHDGVGEVLLPQSSNWDDDSSVSPRGLKRLFSELNSGNPI